MKTLGYYAARALYDGDEQVAAEIDNALDWIAENVPADTPVDEVPMDMWQPCVNCNVLVRPYTGLRAGDGERAHEDGCPKRDS